MLPSPDPRRAAGAAVVAARPTPAAPASACVIAGRAAIEGVPVLPSKSRALLRFVVTALPWLHRTRHQGVA